MRPPFFNDLNVISSRCSGASDVSSRRTRPGIACQPGIAVIANARAHRTQARLRHCIAARVIADAARPAGRRDPRQTVRPRRARVARQVSERCPWLRIS